MSGSTTSTKTSRKIVDIFHIFNGILAKTRNLILQKQNNLVFLTINQMLRNVSQERQMPPNANINSYSNMKQMYGNKDEKKLHYLKFFIIPRRQNSMRNVLTCLTELYNSLNANTATRVDFTNIVPSKFHLWFFCSRFLIYPLVWIG